MKNLLRAETVDRRIYWIREHRVMLDSDLAELYGVTTFNLNKAVRRNWERFPNDFLFQLTPEEHQNLIFQIGISSSRWGGRRHAPLAFTQEGVSMLSSVLRSHRAVQVNIAIMRAFARVGKILSHHKDLAKRLEELEHHLIEHDGQFRRQASQIRTVFRAIQALIQGQEPPKPKRIGFR
jgi:hypothetical protein